MGDRVFQRYRPPVTGALPVTAQMVPGYLENPPGEIRSVSPVVQVPVKLEKGLLHGVLGIGPACTSAHQVTAKWTAQFLEPVQKLPARLSRSLHFVDIRHYPKSIRTTIQQANLLHDKAKGILERFSPATSRMPPFRRMANSWHFYRTVR